MSAPPVNAAMLGLTADEARLLAQFAGGDGRVDLQQTLAGMSQTQMHGDGSGEFLPSGHRYRFNQCFFNCLYNQHHVWRERKLHLVLGSLGFGDPSHTDIHWEYGHAQWDKADTFCKTNPHSGEKVLDAHIWLEDDGGKIFDILGVNFQWVAELHGKKVQLDKTPEVVEGLYTDDLSQRGFVYQAASIKIQQELWTYFLCHYRAHLDVLGVGLGMCEKLEDNIAFVLSSDTDGPYEWLSRQASDWTTTASAYDALQMMHKFFQWKCLMGPRFSCPITESEAKHVLALVTLANRAMLRYKKVAQSQFLQATVATMKEAYAEIFNLRTSCLPSLKQAETIRTFVGDALLLDAGAGSGVVTNLLMRLGVCVHAVDICTMDCDAQYHGPGCSVEKKSMMQALEQHHAKVAGDELVLGFFSPGPASLPKSTGQNAFETLHRFHNWGGVRVVVVGTEKGDATPTFWVYLHEHFDLIDTVNNVRILDTMWGKNKGPAMSQPLYTYTAKPTQLDASHLPRFTSLDASSWPQPTFLLRPSFTSKYCDVREGGSEVQWIRSDDAPAVNPCWLPITTTARLHSGKFTIRFNVQNMQGAQIGVGFGLAHGGFLLDFGFYGYLGASNSTWSYDPSTGDIVTATNSIAGGLPRFKNTDAGSITVHFDLPRGRNGTAQFEIDGQLLSHVVTVPSNAVVVPACCLLRTQQQVRIASFSAVELY